MATNVRKTLTDAGYIAVGLGVLGFQQAQIRGRQLKEHASEAAGCVNTHVHDARTSVEQRTRTAREQAETSVRTTVERTKDLGARTKDLGSELTKRVEPTVEQVRAQLHDLPERVVQAMEPVTARMRERAGTAA